MSPKLWHHRINDMLEAIDKIQQYVKNMDFQAFHADSKTIDAVIRNFIVIGEAARNIPEEVAARHPSVPWRLMSDMLKSRRGRSNEARDVAIYLTRQLRGERLDAICREYGLKKHSSASSTIERVRIQILKDRRFRNRLEELKRSILKSQTGT